MPDKENHRWSDDQLAELRQEIQELAREFNEHAADEASAMARFLKAFPNDDPVSHRQYHEAVMRAAEAQERFWSELRLDIAKKGVWGLIVVVSGLLLAGAAMKMGIKP